MVGILVLALAGMLVAMNAAISPLQKDAELSALLTRYFRERGDLRPDTRLTALRRQGSEKRLAGKDRGSGVVVEFQPARAVLETEGGIGRLARQVARMAHDESPPPKPRWIEVQVRLPGAADPFRTLVAVDDDGHLGPPEPPAPARVEVPAGW
jgi:hypothetical protein